MLAQCYDCAMNDDLIHSNKSTKSIEQSGLPQNLEAEQDLLGALLLSNDIFDKIPDHLDTAHFFNPLHGRIFSAARTLCNKGQLANPVTLKSYFIGDPSVEDVDVENYLRELMDNISSISEAPDYAKDIYQCFLRRQLIIIADETITDSRTAKLDTNAETLIEETEQKLFHLAETNQPSAGLLPFHKPLAEAVTYAEAVLKNESHLSGISTGLLGLNNHLGGLQDSDLVILAGRPGMGKTALATNIAFHAATTTRTGEESCNVAFFSLEMSAQQLASRILSSEAQIPSNDIRLGRISPDQFNDLIRTSNQIETAPFFIDDTPGLSVAQLASRARRLKRTHGLGLLVVDYLQLLSAPMGMRWDNRVQELSMITRSLKNIAKELSIPVLALSQLSRAVEQRDDKRPNLADLRESGTIEQDADVVMFVYREEYYLSKAEPEQKESEELEAYQKRHAIWNEKSEKAKGQAEIIVAKHRHASTGKADARFIEDFTKFTDGISEDYLPERFK